MDKPYIAYVAEIEDVEKSTEDMTVFKVINDTITFEELERHKNCINWEYISNNITKETCTEEFYTRFSDYLNWHRGNFLEYVSEEHLLKKFRIISKDFLFSIKRDLSEDFCIKCLHDYKNYNYDYTSILRCIVKNIKNLSNEFIEKYILDRIQKAKAKDTGYSEISLCRGLANELAFNQKITEEQFLMYVDDSNNEFFTKFLRFVILTKSSNNFSKDFIKSHRKNLNEKSFLETKQVIEYLTTHKMSNGALEVFKNKMDWIGLINRFNLDVNHLEYMIPICKKELFDLFIKHSDKIKNEKRLNELGKLLSK